MALPLVALCLASLGIFFLAYLRLVAYERANLELEQEIQLAMRVLAQDAQEATRAEIVVSGQTLTFHRQEEIEQQNGQAKIMPTRVSYERYLDNYVGRLRRIHQGTKGFQPLTGGSKLAGDVDIEAFDCAWREGNLRVRLLGRSRLTDYRYEQVAVFPLAGAP